MPLAVLIDEMISPLPGWSYEPGERAVTLRPLDERAIGAIRYVERRRPALAFADVVEAHLRRLRAPWRITHLDRPAGPVTPEGESGAMVPLAAWLVDRAAGQ